MDPRVAVEVTAGFAITFAFGTREVVSTWNPMKLPTRDVEQTVTSMKTKKFGINAVYEPVDKT